VIQPHKHDPMIGQARIKVEGRQVGGEGTVTAYIGKHRAQALVQVRSKKEAIAFEFSKSNNALFTDINFDDRMDPRQRVYFDRLNSSIMIATAAPSVKIYLDEQGRLDTTVHGVEIGRFLAPDGAEADAVQNHFIRLQNQYAHLIHQYIVTLD
ncbi:hypothetical protein JZU51_02840, partial [bacterium]|nr:hypothetical protein [bacterium]